MPLGDDGGDGLRDGIPSLVEWFGVIGHVVDDDLATGGGEGQDAGRHRGLTALGGIEIDLGARRDPVGQFGHCPALVSAARAWIVFQDGRAGRQVAVGDVGLHPAFDVEAVGEDADFDPRSGDAEGGAGERSVEGEVGVVVGGACGGLGGGVEAEKAAVRQYRGVEADSGALDGGRVGDGVIGGISLGALWDAGAHGEGAALESADTVGIRRWRSRRCGRGLGFRKTNQQRTGQNPIGYIVGSKCRVVCKSGITRMP